MSVALPSEASLRFQVALQKGNLTVPQFSFLAVLLTLGAVAADQFFAPSLYSSSPLWAVTAALLLVWRKGGSGLEREVAESSFGFSFVRVSLFIVAHLALIFAARSLLGPASSSSAVLTTGWITTALKVSVLVPALLLLPLTRWRILFRVYAAEGLAAVVVLFTFFPARILTSVWPWYGQILGRVVFWLSRLFVPGLRYANSLTPTLQGPDLDVTIFLGCSGISGIELFDYLFAFVALLDWNRLRKGRTLVAYFLGILVILLGNALRITTLVVLGNRGFTDLVAQFHISAGWIFFSVVFLLYLSLVYRKLLATPEYPLAKP